ncbi:Zn(2)-C6 fungal-type domain-containing protein [Mycena sanguinolenta]|uniref:Oxidation resistance protein 1 n=1 Tax=Mycena sanguinolenta TaxID=230812 RepID=A0A8H6Z9V9_9AGAR|nr:Zn(2)-C6 fungal-type domain-containing protein [Mycena sanguinolenta]
MSDPLNSFPVLIPVHVSPKPSTPTPSATKTRAERDREAEEAFDKFSTLFSPATPHASPVLDPLSQPEQQIPVMTVSAPHLSPDSEFGAFVSVSAEQDPLSPMNPGFDLQTPMQAEGRPNHTRTPSQTFFDQFSKSAKDRTETTKRDLLDELLMHEDDPLYWIKDQSTSTSSLPPPEEEEPLPSENTKYMSESLSEIDLEFFASRQAGTIPRRRSSSGSLHLRSPTSTAAPTLAPPLASISSSEDAPGFDSPSHASRFQTPARSGSLASLASLSKSSGANTRTTTPAMPAARVPEISHFTPFGAKSATAYVPPTGAPGFRGTTAYDWDRGFSHALERDLGVTPPEEHPTPYSDGLEAGEELLVPSTSTNSSSRRSSPGNGNGLTPTAKKDGVGVLLDKKMSEVINLVGRREGTVGVLTPELVALIHAHLPALLRLPRQWTLFYSLDQHGISLNTLYYRCAPPSSSRMPHPKGALLVIQDADDALFGAWIADGLKRSTRGGYYGGGESFLWRYLPSSGKFDVYKWTGKNDYVALCEAGFISFGGGDGHYGLYLDESLIDGSSARCPTFDNEPLCSAAEGKGGNVNFECVGLEVWGVGP